MQKAFFTWLALFLLLELLHAQSSLPDSRRNSAEKHIYTIDKKDLRKVYLKKHAFTEDMLGAPVGKFPSEGIPPVLERGNYIIAQAVENRLQLTPYTQDDLFYKIVRSKRFMLCLYDSTGRIIDDARIKYGAGTLPFDKNTRTYNTARIPDGQLLEVEHKGVFHYLKVTNHNEHRPGPGATIFRKIKRKTQSERYAVRQRKHTGFVVFSKPRYRPGETVKLKAYLAAQSGKRYDRPVEIRLSNSRFPYIDTLLTVREPYRPGLYEYEFKLTDSLHLPLDAYYTISLQPAGRQNEDEEDGIGAYFRYEEYELKSIRFSIATDRKTYTRGDPVHIRLKATDDNGMAAYGGRAELTVAPKKFAGSKTNEAFFIPDTLWRHEIAMYHHPEKTVTLPDSIFPPGVSLYFQVKATYLSADNEKKTESVALFRDEKTHRIDFSLEKGMLTIRQLHRGTPRNVTAGIQIKGPGGRSVLTDSVQLPHTLPLPWQAEEVTVTTGQAAGRFTLDWSIDKEQLGYAFYRQNDSIRLHVDNPARIPFWYTVRKKKKDLVTGYASDSLDYSLPATDHGYSMYLHYFFGKTEKHIEQQLPFSRKNLTLDVATPVTVYPGQQVSVQLTVTDKKGKPVPEADITAYATTSKFGYVESGLPDIPMRGLTEYPHPFRYAAYRPASAGFPRQTTRMTWDRWKYKLALDTVEYYKFLYPAVYYSYTEPTADRSTLLQPYVVLDGALQGVYLLWIDERLYYTDLTHNSNAYIFQLSPGKHTVRIRTYDRELRIDDLWIEEGKRNILSFNAAAAPARVRYPATGRSETTFTLTSVLLNKADRGMLLEKEWNYLATQLITLDKNLGAIKFPGTRTAIDRPAYLRSGPTYHLINPFEKNRYQALFNRYAGASATTLLGPFPVRNYVNGQPDVATVYTEGQPLARIGLEGGQRYTVYENYQKIKNWEEAPFSRMLLHHTPVADFKTDLPTPRLIDGKFKEKLCSMLSRWHGEASTTSVFPPDRSSEKTKKKPADQTHLKLELGKDTQGRPLCPVLIYFYPEKQTLPVTYKLYYGATTTFDDLPPGDIRLNLVFNDSAAYGRTVSLRPGGLNYLHVDSIDCTAKSPVAREAFTLFRNRLAKTMVQNPYRIDTTGAYADSTAYTKTDYNDYVFSYENKPKRKNAKTGLITGVVVDAEGEPLIGASIGVKGGRSATVTDFDGEFELVVTAGKQIQVSYIGYKTKKLKCTPGNRYIILLEEENRLLNEVVVTAYGKSRSSYVGGEELIDLTHNDAGFLIRGIGALPRNAAPLVVVNGLPFQGKPEDIDPACITDLRVLKGETARAIYGESGANGVVLILTNAAALTDPEKYAPDETGSDSGNRMRRNFRDDAFWQPRLTTDAAGRARFETTYPDDITGWNASFIAIGNKNQVATRQLAVRSFKTLAARLSAPRFAIRGDRTEAIGRLVNYQADSASVERKIETPRRTVTDSIRLEASHVEYIPLEATGADSLTIAYSLKTGNGFFDGEERSVPLFEPGMLQTSGEFRVIDDTGAHTFRPDPALGVVTWYAETSGLASLVREIDRITRYPYQCNEQLASKLLALLAKKRITAFTGDKFPDDGNIRALIGLLEKNRNAAGQWGWWKQGPTEPWIARHVINALSAAADAGYKVRFDREIMAESYKRELQWAIPELQTAGGSRWSQPRRELLDRLIFLKETDTPFDRYETCFYEIDARLENRSVTDKLKTMYARVCLGLQTATIRDSLLQLSKKTAFGSLYWSNDDQQEHASARFVRPDENAVENTLIAYRLLKKLGGSDRELQQIRNYFFECRYEGHWRNTYESARVIDAILPEMLRAEAASGEVTMFLNGERITRFPYTATTEPAGPVEIKKSGAFPLFVTGYQQAWTREPAAEKGKGFAVRTCFLAGRDTVAKLVAGRTACLEVSVCCESAAEYVQIEVPVPAGCSYENKPAGVYGPESHREYLKEKVVLFCRSLSRGNHTFSIPLLPRYSGTYHLNPAKAELMYFPSFYGNEAIKKIDIAR